MSRGSCTPLRGKWTVLHTKCSTCLLSLCNLRSLMDFADLLRCVLSYLSVWGIPFAGGTPDTPQATFGNKLWQKGKRLQLSTGAPSRLWQLACQATTLFSPSPESVEPPRKDTCRASCQSSAHPRCRTCLPGKMLSHASAKNAVAVPETFPLKLRGQSPAQEVRFDTILLGDCGLLEHKC
jgi:hypothetical protein